MVGAEDTGIGWGTKRGEKIVGSEKQRHHRVQLHYLKISSYMKLCVAAGVSLGLLVGVLKFFIAILNLTSPVQIGSIVTAGFLAGLFTLIATPIMFGFSAVLFSLVSYYPMMLFLRKKNGFLLEGVFDAVDAAEQEEAGKST